MKEQEQIETTKQQEINTDYATANLILYKSLLDELLLEQSFLKDSVSGETVALLYNDKTKEVILTLPTYNNLTEVLLWLKNNYHFQQLIDLCAVDFLNRDLRFEVVYQLLSLNKNWRLSLKVSTNDSLPTISSIYIGAGWYEREAWDLYGIKFIGHKDLRRILTDYNFEGFPLRKDFPLFGNVEVRYDEVLEKVIYEPVSLTENNLTQDYRNFDFRSPWHGKLPGDNKA